MSLAAVLVTGMFAGGVSCAAVQGGLLTGLVARQQATGDSAGNGSSSQTPTRSGAAGGRSSSASRRATRARPSTRQTGRAAERRHPAPTPRPWTARLADDLAPVGGFLAGKLVSHAVLGAALGALGAVVQLAPQTRAFMQLAAGALIVAFALAQLGVSGLHGFTVSPPASWARFVRGRARSQAVFAPALLGLATVLVPCGVTLSVMALAMASGSAISGAATMAVFVVGTGPLFAVIGYAARMAATVWQGRLAAATGAVLLAVGLYTFNGGLTLIGSPLAARNLPETLGLSRTVAAADASTVTVAADGRQTAVIGVSTGRYAPDNVAVKAGAPTTLVFRSDGASGCVRALVIPALNRQVVLPEDGDTTIDVGVLSPGRLDYSCAMGMYSGTITIG